MPARRVPEDPVIVEKPEKYTSYMSIDLAAGVSQRKPADHKSSQAQPVFVCHLTIPHMTHIA